mmetsp:Transcript_85075/g.168821  ORF Transcript_85075/g.168821 Transcript_85075/m.168821 type:complete len:230 (-) Transcript_85075:313-1002(-)
MSSSMSEALGKCSCKRLDMRSNFSLGASSATNVSPGKAKALLNIISCRSNCGKTLPSAESCREQKAVANSSFSSAATQFRISSAYALIEAWFNSERSANFISGGAMRFLKPSLIFPSLPNPDQRSSRCARARSVYAFMTNGSKGSRLHRPCKSDAVLQFWCGKATEPVGPHINAPLSSSVLKHSLTCLLRSDGGTWKRSRKELTNVGRASMRGNVADIHKVLYIGVIIV